MSTQNDLPEGNVGEDLKELALSLGYGWPKDPNDVEGQWRVLKAMAISAARWREEVMEVRRECFREVERERMYQHQQARYVATLRKLKNTRKALREFMTYQVAFVREAMVDFREWRERTSKSNH